MIEISYRHHARPRFKMFRDQPVRLRCLLPRLTTLYIISGGPHKPGTTRRFVGISVHLSWLFLSVSFMARGRTWRKIHRWREERRMRS